MDTTVVICLFVFSGEEASGSLKSNDGFVIDYCSIETTLLYCVICISGVPLL